MVVTAVRNGEFGSSGDGGHERLATIERPNDVTVDLEGNLYVADFAANVIRKVLPEGGILTLAGTGQPGFRVMEGRPPKRSSMDRPDLL